MISIARLPWRRVHRRGPTGATRSRLCTGSASRRTTRCRRRRRTISAPRTPASAPIVFHPYKRPSTRPKPCPCRARPATRIGSVAPIAVVGTTIAAKAMTKRMRLTSHSLAAKCRMIGMNSDARSGSASVSEIPETATTASSSAYAAKNRSIRWPALITHAVPSANPPMKLATTRLVAQTVLPNTSAQRWNQATSKISPAAPDAKNNSETSRSGGGGVSVVGRSRNAAVKAASGSRNGGNCAARSRRLAGRAPRRLWSRSGSGVPPTRAHSRPRPHNPSGGSSDV